MLRINLHHLASIEPFKYNRIKFCIYGIDRSKTCEDYLSIEIVYQTKEGFKKCTQKADLKCERLYTDGKIEDERSYSVGKPLCAIPPKQRYVSEAARHE